MALIKLNNQSLTAVSALPAGVGGKKIGRKKFVRASATAGAGGNPLMTLDFFEGSTVGASKGEESPHTRQLKEFVFIQ